MGGVCCKATFEPNKVHVKKINEILTNCKLFQGKPNQIIKFIDLKNQGIDPKVGKGSEILNQ